MVNRDPDPLRGGDEDIVLRRIFEGTADATGERFFAVLVENLARALDTQGAWVTEYLEDSRRLRSLAFWMNGEWMDYEYAIAGTPCEEVITGARLVHYPDNVLELFPDDQDLRKFAAVSYMGVPLADARGKILGNLAVLDQRPLPEEPRYQTLIRIFAARASAELERLRAERDLRGREAQLRGLIESAMDAIIQIDGELRVVRVNPAAEKVFGCAETELAGSDFGRFLTEEARRQVLILVREMEAGERAPQRRWIPGPLEARRAGGETFAAEATLSRFELGKEIYFTLILRDMKDRLEAERRIRSLVAEAECLREELRALSADNNLLGESPPFLLVLRDVQQVAPTDSTVLILGETGTGKELIARAIHASSSRRGRSLVKVNCAAIPAALIESEFFGHERGAFTGATEKRDGRFALADGGTIFLDEVGELPVALQAKLLRILQEGEFEPVGSSKTRRVDVRVVAATNRDLEQAVREGKFREDLYYRLGVFPIRLPPLRERSDDIARLAAAFTERIARKLGRTIEPLGDGCIRRLRAYGWPGNVRELENVIERAIITSTNGRLNLDRALPEAASSMDATGPTRVDETPRRIRTMEEMEELERANILYALEAAGWKVAGSEGAGRLLGINPSTLNSRMRALGIQRPRE